jgi:very-short-patch-repair endonuclease
MNIKQGDSQPMPYNKQCSQCKKEFSTKDKRQKYCNKSCYYALLAVEPVFKNCTHSEESLKKMMAKQPDNKGENNPFFGKKHSQAVLNIIKEKNQKYRNDHKEKIEAKQLELLNLTKEQIIEIFDDFKNTNQTLTSLAEKHHINRRTLKSYFLKYACSKEEYADLAVCKQNKAFKSMAEEKMYLMLAAAFGEENTIRQKRFGRYTFDVCLFDKLLIEYDGYYWHGFFRNNDDFKNELATKNGYHLYRVLEPESRKTDYLQELKKIKEKIYEIQAQTN